MNCLALLRKLRSADDSYLPATAACRGFPPMRPLWSGHTTPEPAMLYLSTVIQRSICLSVELRSANANQAGLVP
jgi:hypothetical protein